MNTLYCGDNIHVLRTYLQDNSVDMILTSPPYDNQRLYNGYTFDFEALAVELLLVLKPGGTLVWVANDAVIDGSETGTSFRQALFFKDIGFRLHDTMIYEKSAFSFPCKTRYHQVFEYMFILTKGKIKTVNLIQDRKTSKGGEIIRGRSRDKDGTLFVKSGTKKGSRIREIGTRYNIWRYATGHNVATQDSIAEKHPATFPDKLAHDHILSWSNPGDIILDPMAGSGTVLKEAALLGRSFIGIEISGEYVENIICPRLDSYGIEYGLLLHRDNT